MTDTEDEYWGMPASTYCMALHLSQLTSIIAPGLGLILPGIFKIQTRLTWMAAWGLVLVMIGAMVYHISRGETGNIAFNLILLVLLAFVAYGRQRLRPLADRNA